MADDFNKSMNDYIKKRKLMEKSRLRQQRKAAEAKAPLFADQEGGPKKQSTGIIARIKGLFRPKVQVYEEDSFSESQGYEEVSETVSDSEFEAEEKEIEKEETPSFFKRIKNFFSRARFEVVKEEYDTSPTPVERIEGEKNLGGEGEMNKKGKSRLKKGFFGNLFGKSQSYDDQVELEEYGFTKDDMQKFTEMESEIKELGKISLELIKKLDKKELAKYKDSKEFRRFKDISIKYGLIREKSN